MINWMVLLIAMVFSTAAQAAAVAPVWYTTEVLVWDQEDAIPRLQIKADLACLREHRSELDQLVVLDAVKARKYRGMGNTGKAKYGWGILVTANYNCEVWRND